MAASKTELELLGRQSSEALLIAHARAIGASAVHQARGAFCMAELCEDRADAILQVLDARRAEAA